MPVGSFNRVLIKRGHSGRTEQAGTPMCPIHFVNEDGAFGENPQGCYSHSIVPGGFEVMS
jgi:hypothetical protein